MHVCMYVCMYVCVYECTYVSMHVCMYVCMYTYPVLLTVNTVFRKLDAIFNTIFYFASIKTLFFSQNNVLCLFLKTYGICFFM